MRLSWFEEVGGKTLQELVDELNQLRRIMNFLVADRQKLLSEHEYFDMFMSRLSAELSITNCCFPCQLRLVEQNEALERIIRDLEEGLNLLEVKLHTIQEKITFIEGHIPRLIEHEREMLAQEIAMIYLAQEEYNMCTHFM